MTRTLTEFLRTAHLHGLSDVELVTLEALFRAADEWQQYMRHVGDANNFNGTLSRAVDKARSVFGIADGPDDPHVHCHWQCVAPKNLKRCANHKPATTCSCGILSPTERGACTSCRKPFVTPSR